MAKSSDTQEVYVAFSIHGSHCFITANKTVPKADVSGSSIKIDGFSFSKGRSRDKPLRGAVKLLWSALEDKSQPLTDPKRIYEAFQKLAKAGWTVNDADFVKKHKLEKAKMAPMTPDPVEAPQKFIEKMAPKKPVVDPMAAKMANATGAVPAKQGGSLSMPSNDPKFAELDKPLPAIVISDDDKVAAVWPNPPGGMMRGTMDYAGAETGRFEKAMTDTDPVGDPQRGLVDNIEGLKSDETNRDDKHETLGEFYSKPRSSEEIQAEIATISKNSDKKPDDLSITNMDVNSAYWETYVSQSGKDEDMLIQNIESIPFRPSDEFIAKVAEQNPEAAEKLRTLPVVSDDDALPESGSVDDGSRESNDAERMILERTMKKDLSRRLFCVQGDITTLDVDVIINAANARLIPGGGVDGAINKAAGPKLGEAMRALGGCPTGSAKITEGFDLNAYQIVHAVGPVYLDYSDPEAERLLRKAYATAFDLADQTDAHSIAAPLLSTGIYGYPLNSACYIAVDETYKYLGRCSDVATTVTLVAFDQAAYETLLEQSKRVYNDLALTKSDDLPQVTSPHN